MSETELSVKELIEKLEAEAHGMRNLLWKWDVDGLRETIGAKRGSKMSEIDEAVRVALEEFRKRAAMVALNEGKENGVSCGINYSWRSACNKISELILSMPIEQELPR